MNDILRILLGEARPRQAADESLFLSGRNYLGVRPPMPDIPPVAGLPPVPQQVGPVAGLVTINDNGQIIKLAPGEVYEGGIRIIPGPAPTFTGLLDDYPGAAAAFSLRRLSVNYTGPLVQVRRASDNDETTIPYKDDGTLDVDVLNAFAAGTDAFVSEWPDQSGNGFDFSNTTTSEQPKIYDAVTGVNLDNGNPAMSFSSSGLKNTDTINASVSDYTFIAVLNRATIGSDWWFDTSSGRLAISGIAGAYFDGTWRGSALSTGHKLVEFYLKSTGSDIYENASLNQSGLSYGQKAISGQNAIGMIFSGGSRYINGNIQEIIIYPSDQSTNRAGIESNINTYYSIY